MTDTVFHQILQIRSGGKVNMCDINAVQRLAFDSGLYELVVYIEEDKRRYFHFILTGELPEGEENPVNMPPEKEKTEDGGRE